ncbi:hypothetical protein D9M68_797020 [compost metagenome]
MRKPTVWPSGMRRSTRRSVRPLVSCCSISVLPERWAASRSATQASSRPLVSSWSPSAMLARRMSSNRTPGTMRWAILGEIWRYFSLQKTSRSSGSNSTNASSTASIAPRSKASLRTVFSCACLLAEMSWCVPYIHSGCPSAVQLRTRPRSSTQTQ